MCPSRVRARTDDLAHPYTRCAMTDEDDQSQPAPLTPEAEEVLRLLGGEAPRFLVEVGAHDGVTMSTSLPLVQRGWQALLVEPHPKIFERLLFVHGANPDVYCVNGGCGDRSGTMTLHIGKGSNTMLSSLVTDDNPWTRQVRSGDTAQVRVQRLDELLAFRKWPDDYSLLLVDTEGFDARVLVAAGLGTWRPRIIITEEYLFNLEWLQEKHQLLWDNGYAPFKRTGDNMIWLRRSDWHETLARYVESVEAEPES